MTTYLYASRALTLSEHSSAVAKAGVMDPLALVDAVVEPILAVLDCMIIFKARNRYQITTILIVFLIMPSFN
jgi:hypothetical protein